MTRSGSKEKSLEATLIVTDGTVDGVVVKDPLFQGVLTIFQTFKPHIYFPRHEPLDVVFALDENYGRHHNIFSNKYPVVEMDF
ncbi:hypothetical protein DFA_08247 [Cavenderia fasciculata]|uniref:Uncharacterized protein n=1 Tax=Cavenderia fasciculata TaxID=261658 RepID=F4Q5J7_CACFS|nr:uncharacterized protein DFA_08247 [Cavenderia fasciculata]EGG17256.1 hypothetical protein DFA_08247 [Cavenderia fasciculata]|eukprot:XP_004355740.1 hypothetical protein DFA_08247 [Cavenderia fasciculata]